MLIRVVVTNFRSYREETEFNMLPSSSVRRKDWHVHKTNSGIDVLSTAVLYGANGSGKSCLIKALKRIQDAVRYGYLPKNVSRDTNKYNETDVPVTIEIEFSTSIGQYSYGLSYNGSLCVEEWLYITAGSPKCVFERKYDKSLGKSVINLSLSKKKDASTRLLTKILEDNLLKSNQLLLSKYDVINSETITDAHSWIVSKLKIIRPESRSTSIFDDRYSNSTFKLQSEKLLRALDLGISSLSLVDEDLESFKSNNSEWTGLSGEIDEIIKNWPDDEKDKGVAVETGTFTISIRRENNKFYVRRVKSVHKVDGQDYGFELKEESDGTQRIFDFVPMVQSIKKNDYSYVIDEIDRSLHPALVRALVTHIVSDTNLKGQLIFTTHDAGLLDCKLFRNDEIWFVEKNRSTQSTHLYTLDEFKPRADLDIEKGYLNGRFGAIPFLAELNSLDWE